MASSKWYVGVKSSGARTPFKSEFTPTRETHGNLFGAVIGPFRTKRGAMFDAAVGRNNPHIQHVRDAERIAAKYA
jgi:hypothetical protein